MSGWGIVGQRLEEQRWGKSRYVWNLDSTVLTLGATKDEDQSWLQTFSLVAGGAMGWEVKSLEGRTERSH